MGTLALSTATLSRGLANFVWHASSGLVVLQVEEDSLMPTIWLGWPGATCAWACPLFYPKLLAASMCEGPPNSGK